MPIPVLGLPKFPSELDYQYSFTKEVAQDVLVSPFQSGITARNLRTSHRKRTFTIKFKTVTEPIMNILEQFYNEIGGPLKPFIIDPPVERFGRYTQLVTDGSQELQDFEDGSLRAGSQAVVVRFTENFDRTLFKPLLETTGLVLEEVLGEDDKGKYIEFDGLLESQNATIPDHEQDYLDLGTKDFMFDFLFRAETIFVSSGASYAAMAGKTLIFTIEGTTYTVTFTASATNASTTAEEINDQQGDFVEAQVFGTTELKIRTVAESGYFTISGTAFAKLTLSAPIIFPIHKHEISDKWVGVAPQLGAEINIFSLAELNGKIYGGTGNNGKLYEWNGTNAWVEVAPQLGAASQIVSLIEFNGKLYGGTNSLGKLYEWNGTNAWVEVAPQLGTATIIQSLVVYDSKLYGSTNVDGSLYEWNGTNAWVEVAGQLGAETVILSLVVYDNKIYGGTSPGGKLYEWNGINAWVEVAPHVAVPSESRVFSLAVFNNMIYGGTGLHGNLFKWNGTNAWVQVAPQLGAETQINALAVLNNELYGGTSPSGKLYKWNGTDAWIEMAGQLGAETDIRDLIVFNNRLFGGTSSLGKLYTIESFGYFIKQDGIGDLTFLIEGIWGDVATITADSSFHLLDGSWHYVVIIIDRSGNGQIYIDSVASGSAVDVSGIRKTIDNGADFYLHKDANANIQMDRVGGWSWDGGDLPTDIATRIATLHADWSRIDNDDGLQVLWTFDESDGSDSKQQENLTLINDPAFFDFAVQP